MLVKSSKTPASSLLYPLEVKAFNQNILVEKFMKRSRAAQNKKRLKSKQVQAI
jgi:hypothetical protein